METVATKKGQIVIPVELRRKYDIQAGTRLEITDDGEQIILRPITAKYVRSLRGSLRGRSALQALAEERLADKER